MKTIAFTVEKAWTKHFVEMDIFVNKMRVDLFYV